jgi:hypothetical protein
MDAGGGLGCSDLTRVFRQGMAPAYQTAIEETTKKNMEIFRNHAMHYLMKSLTADETRRALEAGIRLDGIPSGTKPLTLNLDRDCPARPIQRYSLSSQSSNQSPKSRSLWTWL